MSIGLLYFRSVGSNQDLFSIVSAINRFVDGCE